MHIKAYSKGYIQSTFKPQSKYAVDVHASEDIIDVLVYDDANNDPASEDNTLYDRAMT